MSTLDKSAAALTDWRARDLALPLPVFEIATTCGHAFDWFKEHKEQVAAAVVDGAGKVVGIANRLRFLARYAQPYVPELYSKKSIQKLANTNPLVVDEKLPLTQLGHMLTLDWPDALRECFVVTHDGAYLGIGTSEALVKGKLGLLLDRERQLADALAKAHAANKAKTNFLALMSHELRTPLNAIIGFSEVLSNEIFGSHAVPRYREYSADIHFAGKHLLALINDILDLSKFEAGKMELHAEPVEVGPLFGGCVRLVSERARERGLKIRSTVPANFPHIQADRLRIKQVLLNLLSNAVKFTPSGGRVSLSAELNADGSVCLGVSDTGIGMSPEQIPMALEPFQQIDSPLCCTEEGTGLGLALVKAMVEQHGGVLEIESALNKGTTVRVTLPSSRAIWAQHSDVA
ncbi:MAG TPA: ATP-binding protein [Rhizomicrobium sp.]|nr:ATP-binding protein [Rhizomicrobium sp.]